MSASDHLSPSQHGKHEPTPLENWNKYKTKGEKDAERFRGYAQEITQNGGNPDALSSPYGDPYEHETSEAQPTITFDPSDPRWKKGMRIAGPYSGKKYTMAEARPDLYKTDKDYYDSDDRTLEDSYKGIDPADMQ